MSLTSFAICLRSLVLHLVEVALQRVEAGGPKPSIGGEPLVDFSKHLRAELIYSPLCLDSGFHQAGLPKHAKVLGDGGLGNREFLD
jgi:hypothetical protein